MGAWRHRLSSIDPETRTAICEACGPTRIRVKSSERVGPGRWRCVGPKYGERAYRAVKKDECERCGFTPEHPRQLDVHHRDGDHSNNTEGNLVTLCANCHRLVHV